MTQIDFKWLQISDLHAGAKNQNLHWPNVKHEVFRDFERLYDRVGPWDLVIFSGDMTFSGAPEEYAEVTKILKEMWAVFAAWGFEPKFFAIPGNHDLKRPVVDDPKTILLQQWFGQASVRSDFFAAKGKHGYRSFVERTLESFGAWYRTLQDHGIRLADHRSGSLPGDQLANVKLGNAQVGIVGLNSTWLQLTGDDAKGKLHVALEQISSLDDDIQNWAQLNDFNILCSHHPTDWLHPDSLATWRSDVDPPGRFDLHLFGHMHEGRGLSTSESGAATRHLIQAPSLFGLEKLADGKTERRHGYVLGQFSQSGESRRVRVWPREMKMQDAGNRVMRANQAFDLQEGEFYEIALQDSKKARRSRSGLVGGRPSFVAVPEALTGADPLAKARYTFQQSQPHREVRRAEQQQCVDDIKRDRCTWVLSEWGLAADEFIAAVAFQTEMHNFPAFRIELNEVGSLDEFITQFPGAMGCGFAQFFEQISVLGPATLIIDEVAKGNSSDESLVDDLSSAILEYCPDLVIFLRSRVPARSSVFRKHELRALDEADLKVYVTSHPRGGEHFAAWDTVIRLHAYTDGIPSRVDEALRELEVVGLSELKKHDGNHNIVASETAPLALRKVVQGLAEADERQTKRSFELLCALTVFPKGVQLTSVSRFNGVHGFFPNNALQLLDLGLIVSAESRGMAASNEVERGKLLVLPHPVRDYVRSLLDSDASADLDRKAGELFFGPNWVSGAPAWPTNHDYESPQCSNESIANASALLQRLLQEALASRDDRRIDTVSALAGAFAKALNNGSHYLSLATLCQEIIPLLEQIAQHPERLAMCKFRYAEALRMTGRREKAKELLRTIEDYPFSKKIKQDVLVTLALCNEGSNDEDAIDTARRAVKIDRNSSQGTHAQALIFQLDTNDPERIDKLRSLEQIALKKKQYIQANNIALFLATEEEDVNQVDVILSRVMKDASKDFYNGMRALIRRCVRKLIASKPLSDAEHAGLISSYQFLFNEKMDSLFDSCTEALWSSFSNRGETENLLALFRHSSLVWRLRGADSLEQKYIAKLRVLFDSSVRAALENDRVVAYFLVRAAG